MTNPLDLLRRRRASRRASAGDEYWRLIAETVAGMHKTEKAAANAAELLDAAAGELRLDVDTVEQHVAGVRELRDLQAAGDADAVVARLKTRQQEISEQEQAEDAAWSAAAEARRLRGNELVEARHRLTREFEENSARRRRVEALRQQLEAAGAPATVIGGGLR
jgi:hypothetical protein